MIESVLKQSSNDKIEHVLIAFDEKIPNKTNVDQNRVDEVKEEIRKPRTLPHALNKLTSLVIGQGVNEPNRNEQIIGDRCEQLELDKELFKF